MQSASSRIWTWVTVHISCEDNHYKMITSRSAYIFKDIQREVRESQKLNWHKYWLSVFGIWDNLLTRREIGETHNNQERRNDTKILNKNTLLRWEITLTNFSCYHYTQLAIENKVFTNVKMLWHCFFSKQGYHQTI